MTVCKDKQILDHPISLETYPSLAAVKTESEDAIRGFKTIENSIFFLLKEEENISRVINDVKTFVEGVGDKRSALAEIAHLIAAAAAVETRTFESLVCLIENLVADEPDLFGDLGVDVGMRCLRSFPERAHLFILLLVERNLMPIEILPQHIFPFKQRTCAEWRMLIFCYPEFEKASTGGWVHSSYNQICGPTFQGGLEFDLNKLVPPEIDCGKWDEANWEEFNRLRHLGHHTSDVIDLIKQDKVQELSARFPENLGSQEIPFCLYEQFVPLPWSPVDTINVAQLAAFYGARNCWQMALESSGAARAGLLTQSARAAAVGGHDAILAFFEGNREAMEEILIASIQNHDEGLFQWVLGKLDSNEKISDKVWETIIWYDNFTAFETLVKREFPSQRAIALCARHNSVTMFKYLVSHSSEVCPYQSFGKKGQTILHYAVMGVAYPIVHWWAETFGAVGFDALDGYHRNPHHYAILCGLLKPRGDDEPDPEVRFMEDLARGK